jgi:hypothetical protein
MGQLLGRSSFGTKQLGSVVPVCVRKIGRFSSVTTRSHNSCESLLNVPGIGKTALDRLRCASVDSVAGLCGLYIEEHGRKKENFIAYLKVRGSYFCRFLHPYFTLDLAASRMNGDEPFDRVPLPLKQHCFLLEI